MWTRSWCASLPGLWKRFSQCPQTCTVAPAVANVEPAPPVGTSDALLEAVALFGPSSSACPWCFWWWAQWRQPSPPPSSPSVPSRVPSARPAIACACAASAATCHRGRVGCVRWEKIWIHMVGLYSTVCRPWSPGYRRMDHRPTQSLKGTPPLPSIHPSIQPAIINTQARRRPCGSASI